MNPDNSLEKDMLELVKAIIKTKGNNKTWEAIERVTLPAQRLLYRKYFLELGGQIPEREILKVAIEVHGNDTVKIYKV